MTRLAVHGAVAAELARCGDRELSDLLDAAEPLGSGIGGPTALLDVGATPVFVKRLPLTDWERQPSNVGSTANLFELPVFCHYGVGVVGGPGFGAWRELAVHLMTTDWVLKGAFEGFPLMYHWRVLPHPGQSLPEELADVDRAVAYWGGGPEVRRRIEALSAATACIALFLEYVPWNLHDWLGAQVEAGGEALAGACAVVDTQLAAGVSFMNSRGLLHFDAHFENILTDGERLYFGDYGLAISSRFDLSAEETEFFAGHSSYDRRYTAAHLVMWLVTALYGYSRDDRNAFIGACAAGERPTDVPEAVAEILVRHAPVAETMIDFYRRFRESSRLVPYPG